MKEYYEKHKEELFREPRRINLYLIAAKAASPASALREEVEAARKEQLAKFEAMKAGIKTLEDFKKMASEHSEIAGSRDGSVGEVTETYRGGLNGALVDIPVKTVVGPVEKDGMVYLLWADSILPERIAPFEEVTEKIKGRIEVERRRQAAQRMQDEELGRYDLTFLF